MSDLQVRWHRVETLLQQLTDINAPHDPLEHHNYKKLIDFSCNILIWNVANMWSGLKKVSVFASEM